MNEFYGKTVLVTGATGFIGSHIVDSLMAMRNVKVIALSRREDKLKNGFKEYIGRNNFSFIVADVTEQFAETITEHIDYIFHAASPMEGKIIANYPVDVIKPNLNGTINCLELLRSQKEIFGQSGRLILFSSVTVYANNTENDRTVYEHDTNITEILESVSAPYSQAKRMSEVITQAYIKQYGVNAVIARLSTVYGNTRFRPDTAFFQFINAALAHEDIIMNTSGIGRRDNIYIDDAVSGLLIIATLGENGQAYNVSSNGELGNFAAVDEIGQAILNDVNERNRYTGEDIMSVHYKDEGKNIRKPGLKLDNSKLKKLNWELHTGLVEGIHRTINSILQEENV